MAGKRIACMSLLGACVLQTSTFAQEAPTAISEAAMPGLHRALVGETLRPGLSAIAGLGYGFTESVLGDKDQHHSALNTFGVSYAALPWLGVGAGLSNRFDVHRKRLDTTFVGVPTFALRGVYQLDHEWTLGTQIAAWMPTIQTTSFDSLAFASKTISPRFRYHLNAGFRIDRSAASIEEERIGLMRSDLLSLGASDSNALLFAAAWDWRAGGNIDVFGEWSYDLLVGDDAPDIQESPMRFAAGARFPVAKGYRVSVGVETNISRVPPVDARLALVPVEPIATLVVGFSRRPDPPPIPFIPPPPMGQIDGIVATQDDKPIGGATVKVGVRQVLTLDDGRFHFGQLEPGPTMIHIDAPGHVVAPMQADVTPGRVVRIPIVAVDEATPGQIRMFVRGLEGAAVNARVTVYPGDKTLETDAEGVAEIELAPGDYKVTVEAEGHSRQERNVTVDAYGVTILNLDLMTERVQE